MCVCVCRSILPWTSVKVREITEEAQLRFEILSFRIACDVFEHFESLFYKNLVFSSQMISFRWDISVNYNAL